MALNILVVEDNKRMRTKINDTLAKMDIEINKIYQADNGKKGLELLKKHSIDLMLTDIDMPVMNGLEMLGLIRSDPNISEIPTIVLTSRRDMKLFNAITSSGLGYIHKPFSWRMLRKKVHNFKNGGSQHVVQ
ncbi:response regulator [Fodinibius sp. Rm-B-1B1-1]|uniref:response regulator n=1 Tax=Fodinibius alkaliphilus TaxID=3140241 RepID=UPI003159D51D